MRNISYTLSGITPAGAGKTGRALGMAGFGMDHPRRCGENIYAEKMTPAQAGSPPQVRGKLHRTCNFKFCHRITPAGAGKTDVRLICELPSLDHPRRCGENQAFRSIPLAF